MEKIKMPTKFNQSDVDFLACSVAYMEISGRGIKVEHIVGNMSENQKYKFYERLEFYRIELLDIAE